MLRTVGNKGRGIHRALLVLWVAVSTRDQTIAAGKRLQPLK
jgi:hypothetical protein